MVQTKQITEGWNCVILLYSFQDCNSPVGERCLYQRHITATRWETIEATAPGDVRLQSDRNKFIHVEFYVHGWTKCQDWLFARKNMAINSRS